MKATPRPQFPFETASLLLFAALSLGQGTAAWAYSAEPGRKAQVLRAHRGGRAALRAKARGQRRQAGRRHIACGRGRGGVAVHGERG